jgi:hypothetical protein
MATSLNASSTGSGGLVQTADASGILQLQSNGTVALTVNADASVSMNTGTANGVAYLNGSNVLTTGSALVFDGGRLLVGLSSSIASNGIAQIGGNADTRLIVDGSSTQGIYFTKSGADNGTYRVDGSGNFNWFVKGSGSANMTLDASGNLSVGVTSASGYRLRVVASGSSVLALTSVGSTTSSPTQDWFDSTNNTEATLSCSTDKIDFGAYSNHPLVFRTNNVERARIDTSGNLLVATTSAAPNTINSTYVQSRLGTVANMYSGFSNTFGFVLTANSYQYTGGTNRRLVSGYTSRLDLRSDDGTITTATATTGAADSNITFTSGPYIANLGTSWTNASDERLKNITGEIQNALAKVCTLRAAEYTWKDGENTKPQVGLIAQDLLEVLPEVVVVPETETDSEGKQRYLGVNYDQVTALLVAAIKEQQAIITMLTDRITALEAK